MKQILVFAGFYHPHIGGYEKYVYELFHRLSEQGYTVDIVTTNTNSASLEEKTERFNIYRLPCWNILDGTYPVPRPSFFAIKLFFKLLGNRYVFINTQTRFFITSLMGLVFSKIKRIPLIHTEHGSRHSIVANRLVDIFSRTYDHFVGSILVKTAAINTGVSEAAGRFLKHLGATNIEVIPYGIDTDLRCKVDPGLRARLHIERELIITYVGRLIYGKGLHDLIAVIPGIKTIHPGIKFLIVGSGPYLPTIMEMIQRNNCENEVLLLGQKQASEVIEILGITDIFVNPSYSEGLPTSVMEAAAMGLPIIASDVGGTREIVTDQKTGYLIEAGDRKALEKQLVFLIEHPEARKQLADAAYEDVVKKYDWTAVLNSWSIILGGAREKN